MKAQHKTTKLTTSPNDTVVTSPGQMIVDGSGNQWSLISTPSNGYEVAENGILDAMTPNATELGFVYSSVYYQSASNRWYQWVTSAWKPATNPLPAPGSGPVAPAQAAADGYTTATFNDDFTNPNDISTSNTGIANWYLYDGYDPTDWNGQNMNSSDFYISNGDLFLTNANGWPGLNTINSTNPAVSTPTAHAANTGNGLSFMYGYFEASMKFATAPGANGPSSGAWPDFWMNAVQALTGVKPYAEIDFMEAYPTSGSNPPVSMVGTVHQWGDSTSASFQNASNAFPATLNLNDFNTYGCLWTPTSLTWYVNNQKMFSVPTTVPTPVISSSTGLPAGNQTFTAVNASPEYMQLGTGTNWTTEVDWVHVFQ